MRLSIFGNELKEDWKQCLDLFFNTYRNFPNITRPLKLYILSAHTNEFIEKLSIGKGLGFYSEQIGEAIHRDFEKIFIKHNIKDIDHDNYGKHLKKAVTEFSSLHL